MDVLYIDTVIDRVFWSSHSEIDKNLDQMANMRKDKIIMEGKLKK